MLDRYEHMALQQSTWIFRYIFYTVNFYFLLQGQGTTDVITPAVTNNSTTSNSTQPAATTPQWNATVSYTTNTTHAQTPKTTRIPSDTTSHSTDNVTSSQGSSVSPGATQNPGTTASTTQNSTGTTSNNITTISSTTTKGGSAPLFGFCSQLLVFAVTILICCALEWMYESIESAFKSLNAVETYYIIITASY